MKYRIYVGTWSISSTIQLKEYYQAFAYDKSSYFSKEEIQAWKKGINIDSIVYNTQAFNSIYAVLDNQVTLDMLEDGLILLGKSSEDFKKDTEYLYQFLKTQIGVFLHNMRGRDITVPQVTTEELVSQGVIIEVKRATKKQLQDIFDRLDCPVYKKVSLEKGGVWIGERVAVIYNSVLGKEDITEMVRYLMFARLYEQELKNMLYVQRTLWNQIEGIRYQRLYKYSELPDVRDRALTIQSNTNFYYGRSQQMNHFLSWREEYIDEYLKDHILSTTFWSFFRSLTSTQKYLHELWGMTIRHADVTVEAISLLYGDTHQRELQTLQRLFLVSTVISVLSLGALAGSKMVTYTKDGELLSQTVVASWSIDSFVFYGLITLVIALLFYLLFYIAFGTFRKAKRIIRKK
ncbi:hypothetical protein KKG22_05095 [Patescibacteria group bacterium]|nr:hypothetical protein [Patescibacteria group bacterium]MBU1721601.1 hypothetical protein [Patescibacteria group bacterium]MBU1901827.1 hypothetical protein [Patescibacteria group bacterium]